MTVYRDKNPETLLAVIRRDRKYRADRMSAPIVADIISKEKTTKQVSFADEQVNTMQDISMPRRFLSKNKTFLTTAEDLSKIWGIIISQAALTLKETT